MFTLACLICMCLYFLLFWLMRDFEVTYKEVATSEWNFLRVLALQHTQKLKLRREFNTSQKAETWVLVYHNKLYRTISKVFGR